MEREITQSDPGVGLERLSGHLLSWSSNKETYDHLVGLLLASGSALPGLLPLAEALEQQTLMISESTDKSCSNCHSVSVMVKSVMVKSSINEDTIRVESKGLVPVI